MKEIMEEWLTGRYSSEILGRYISKGIQDLKLSEKIAEGISGTIHERNSGFFFQKTR